MLGVRLQVGHSSALSNIRSRLDTGVCQGLNPRCNSHCRRLAWAAKSCSTCYRIVNRVRSSSGACCGMIEKMQAREIVGPLAYFRSPFGFCKFTYMKWSWNSGGSLLFPKNVAWCNGYTITPREQVSSAQCSECERCNRGRRAGKRRE